MYLGENYYAQYQNDIYLNKFTNKLLIRLNPLKCPCHKMKVYIIRIVLKRRLWKYKTDLKLSLFSQSNKAMIFENFKF
jgi:hypothetical protein